jgi:hypothetical protein
MDAFSYTADQNQYSPKRIKEALLRCKDKKIDGMR